MIGNVNIRVSAGHVNLPLPPVAVFKDSAASVIIEGVQAARDGIAITTVKLAVVNAAGTTLTTSAKLTGKNWTATVPATHFAAAGSTRKGVTVFCGGTDENGTAREWNLGTGDLVVISCDSTAVNLGEYTNVRMLSSVPQTPHKGDMALVSGVYKLYDGTQWISLGGGSAAVASVNGKTGAVVLAASDVGALAANGTAVAAAKVTHSLVSSHDDSIEFDGSSSVYFTPASWGCFPIIGGEIGGSINLAGHSLVSSSTSGAKSIVSKINTVQDKRMFYIDERETYATDNDELAVKGDTRYAIKSDSTSASNSVSYVSGVNRFTVTPPAAVQGRTRDWVIYLFVEEGFQIALDAGEEGAENKWFSDDASGVKTINANTLTAIFCTEIRPSADGVSYFAIHKVELEEVA